MYKGWHNKETYLAYLYLKNERYDWVSYAEKSHLLDLKWAITDEIHSLVDWLGKYDDDLYWDLIDFLDVTIDYEELAEVFQEEAENQAKEREEKAFLEYLMSFPEEAEEEEEEIWEDEEEEEIWEDEED